MQQYKKPLVFTLALLPFIIAGAIFAAVMSVESANASLIEEALRQLGSKQALIAATAVQPIPLTVASAFFGYILSEKIGLMRPFGFRKEALGITLALSLIGGAVFSLDAWTFGKWLPQVAQSYVSAGSFDVTTWIASVLYGGIAEELMMRLFLMSLLAFLAQKYICKTETAPVGALISANVIAAFIFAAAHLPATMLTFGTLTPLIICRCFLLNGVFGLLFGYLYRKHGIQYAMLAHILFHLVARTIWLLAF